MMTEKKTYVLCEKNSPGFAKAESTFLMSWILKKKSKRNSIFDFCPNEKFCFSNQDHSASNSDPH